MVIFSDSRNDYNFRAGKKKDVFWMPEISVIIKVKSLRSHSSIEMETSYKFKCEENCTLLLELLKTSRSLRGVDTLL